MTGRTRLSWVTALTIASLLLGGGALNAFADGHGGGKGNGGGNGKVEHAQQQPQHPAAEKHDVQTSSGHSDNSGHGNADRQDRNEDEHQVRGPDHDANEDMDRDDDLVTPPARVTDEVRPGKGCGDENHVHQRNDECKDKHDIDSDDNNDDGAAVVQEAEAEDD